MSHVLPDWELSQEDELIRFKESLKNFQSYQMPGVLLAKALQPSDPQGNFKEFWFAKAKEIDA